MDFSSNILGEAPGGAYQQPGSTPPAATTRSTSTINNENTTSVCFSFLDVLDTLRQYQVPSVDLKHPVGTTRNEFQSASVAAFHGKSADRANPVFSYVLGGGYSAVVLQHATKEDVFAIPTDDDVIARRTPRLVAKSGTLVAFKKISPRPSGNGISDAVRQSEAFRTICQEIAVCRHPLLQNHENIGKLLYVAWQRLESFPWIALELADFGTLDDVLTAPGEGATFNQKCNLTIDIALGVAALHHIGMVHGDLKPANILVHHHPDRQIVGQIADFGGSATLGKGMPSIGTLLWCPPEVILAAPNIDWKLADTWSYGLITASIWSHLPHAEKYTTSCYLDRLVPEQLEGEAREARILIIKSEPDDSPNSLISSCSGLLPFIASTCAAILSYDSTQRKPLEALIDEDLSWICASLGRELSNNYFHEPPPQPLPFKVWADGYRSRDFENQQLVYEHLTEAARPLREAIVLASKHSNGTLWKSGDHSPPIEKRFDRLLRNPAELWRAFIDDACESAISYSRCFGRQEIVAFQVAMSHCLQLGVYLNEDELVSWTYVAAKGGHPQAVWVAPLLEASCMSSSADRDYRMVCLAIGACLGSIPSLVALKAADRTMYELTRTAIQLRHRQEFGLKHSIMLLQEFMDVPRIDLSKCSLVEALKSQNVDRARSLLGDHSLDLSNMFDQNGRNALHALTYLEDEDTDGLALLACVHGADLSRFAYLHERTSVMLYRRGIEGTPLQWAAVKGMVQLFGDLMQIHEETGTVITDALPIAMRTAALHHCDILSMLLIQREKTPGLFSDGVPFGSNYLLVQAMLGASLTVADTVPLARRLLHGPGSSMAQKNTINLLLSKGANVHGPCYEFDDWTPLSGDHTAISLAISYHDDIALSLLLNHMEASRAETNTLELLNGTLQYCIAQESLKCFEVVLDAFPLLINVSPTTKGLTPLNIAARNRRSDYALALLERGADTSVHHENFSPLARAILDGYLETAEIIYNFCSDTERQQTFGYNSVTGFTMMGRIMSLWYAGRKSKVLIDAMKWVQAKGGAHFESDIASQTPIWNMVFHRRAFSSAEDGFLDDMMLATLFDIFPEMLNRPDPDGLFPIHRAVRTGHRKAIELLLEKNVNIDAEIVKAGTKVPAVLVGATAFSLAARQLELDPPRDISMGGRLEMRRWRERMKDIMQLLLSKGATIGQNPQLSDLRRFLLATGANGTVITPASQRGAQDDELEWDKDIWPRKLPPDATSLVENQRAGGEHVPIEMKQAMQILNPRSLRQKRKMLPEDEMDDFAQYGQWVIGLAKARREQYIRHGSGHLASSIEEQDVNLLPDSWQRWHACSVVPKSAEEETRGDASRVDELEGAKGKGKMPVDR